MAPLSEILIILHLAEHAEIALRAPDGQGWQYFRDNFYAKVVIRFLREIWRITWVIWPLPTVLLEPFHLQKDLVFHSDVEPDFMQRRQATSKGLHGVDF
jgi:hypothetical protein